MSTFRPHGTFSIPVLLVDISPQGATPGRVMRLTVKRDRSQTCSIKNVPFVTRSTTYPLEVPLFVEWREEKGGDRQIREVYIELGPRPDEYLELDRWDLDILGYLLDLVEKEPSEPPNPVDYPLCEKGTQ